MHAYDFPLRHRLAFRAADDGGFFLCGETIEKDTSVLDGPEPRRYYAYDADPESASIYPKQGGLVSLTEDPAKSERSILERYRDPVGLPEMANLGERYKHIKIYRNWPFGVGSPLRAPQSTDERADFLAESLDNLALVLNRFKREPEVKRTIRDALRDLNPAITDFDVEVIGRQVRLFLEEGTYSISAARLSDGTLRYLCLLAILCHPQPPPLVCIDEPELGLHPDALLTIAKLIEEASERTQLIVTTHSEFLVDSLTHDPGAIVVCEKGENGTTMRRLDGEKLAVWLKDYSLGNLWTSGQIGGNRW